MTADSHDYVSSAPDVGGEHFSVGYPEECLDFTSFGGSLGALVTDGEWLLQPFTQKDLALIVDFASDTEEEAEQSLARGSNGAWEFPTGNVNTVRSRVETNAQNARIERHLSLITTGQPMREFFWKVVEKLLDEHSCKDPACRVCKDRFPRDLAMVFTLLADLGLKTIYLFSKWQPSEKLRSILDAENITIQWNPLSAIPQADLEANRYYSIWDGTEKQYQDFMAHFWEPSWRSASRTLATKTPSSKKRKGVLKIHLPVPNPQWKSLTSMHFQGTYAMHASAFTVAQRADFVKEANRICLLLLRKLREMTTDPSDFTWVLLPETLAAATNVSSSVEAPTWHVGVQALLKSGDEASESLWNAWAPLLDAALRFAMPVEPAGTYDISDGDPNNHVTFHHDPLTK